MNTTRKQQYRRWLVWLICLALEVVMMSSISRGWRAERVYSPSAIPSSEPAKDHAAKAMPPTTGPAPIIEPAQSGGSFNFAQSVVPGGGGASAGGASALTGSIGQSILGASSGSGFSLSGGFWAGAMRSCSAITVNPPLLPAGTASMAYSQPLTAAGGFGAVTWSVTSGALPSGISLSSSGLLTGATTQTGIFTFTVRATFGGDGCFGERNYKLLINPASTTCSGVTINIAPATLPAATQGEAYAQTLTASGGAAPYTFDLSAGALPAGLNLSDAGVLSGAPTVSGSFNFRVRARDANNCEGLQPYTLQVNPPAAGRIIRALAASGAPGGAVAVPVELASQGDENALGFSLNFDPTVLSNPLASLGSGAAGASFNVSLGQVASGRIGLAVAMPVGQTFAAGARQIAVVTFTIASPTSASSAPITFGDQPTAREVVGIAANTLATSYVNGVVTISTGYEADVAPRPNGNNNGTVTVADWTLIGRFVSNQDTPAPGSEYQRADCAPRDTLGNGSLTIADWVQAGRYAAGVDPIAPAGGPAAPISSLTAGGERWAASSNRQAFGGQSENDAVRARAVRAIVAGGTAGAVTLTLDAQGDENALGFSLLFNPSQWRYVSAVNGVDAADAVLNVNAAQAAKGRLGFALALPSGRAFAAGARQLVVLTFAPAASSSVNNAASVLAISFADAPVTREVVAVNALTLDAGYAVELPGGVPGPLANVSAASYRDGELAREQIVAAFGANLSAIAAGASGLPLPAELAGASVVVTDSNGVTRPAPLFFASPTQINYLIPAGAADGVATITVTNSASDVAISIASITPVSPSLFTADASGVGLPAARLLRVNAAGEINYEDLALFDAATSRFTPVPINLGPETDQVFLALYGTGIRGRSALSGIACTIGDVTAEVSYAAEAPGFVGLDQVNVKLPRSLIGRGDVVVILRVDGKTANAVRINVR